MPCRATLVGDKVHIRVRNQELAQHGYPHGKMQVVVDLVSLPQEIQEELTRERNGLSST